MLSELLNRKEQKQKLTPSQFSHIHTWRHFVLLELLELEECDQTKEWMAKRLDADLSEVEQTLAELRSAGMLDFNGATYRITANQSETDMDIPSEDIKSFHRGVLRQAETSLQQSAVDEREFLAMTLAFPKSSITEAKRAIRQFQDNFAKMFYSEDERKDSVYQLSIQFFRMDREP